MSKVNSWLYDEENAKKRLKIATTAMQCDRAPAKNRERISSIIKQIMEEHPDIELVVFGEMILGWYDPLGMPEYHHKISETIPGPTTEQLGNISKEYGVFLCCGLSERTENGYHNSQVLIDSRGEIQTIHRKWNLKLAERQIGYIPGQKKVTITEIKGIKIGMVICADLAHPQTMRELAQSDLDLILYSLADDKDEKWFMAKANARMYDAWVVSANRYGNENNYWNGHTIITDPLGNLREVLVDEEGYLVHTLKFAQDRSIVQKILRTLYVKVPLLVHVMINWRILKSYYQ